MIDGIKLVQNENGEFEEYDDTYDVVIHCESAEEQERAINILKDRQWISVDERLPEDIDRRYFMCLVENHLEDPPMFCQYEEEYGFGFWKDIYDPVTLGFVDSEFETMEDLKYEKVLYWMPMIEPPEEAMQDD